MADFTGNIHSVTFMDYPQNTLLEILYKDPHVEREGFTPWHMEVDFTNNDFTELLQEWSLDKIEWATKKDLLAERAEFDAMVDKHIQDKWEKEEEPKLRAAYDAVDEYAKKQYEMLEQDGRQIYKAADEYGEKQKNKKYQEVQEEFKAYRKELQGRYQDVTDVQIMILSLQLKLLFLKILLLPNQKIKHSNWVSVNQKTYGIYLNFILMQKVKYV